MWDPHTQKALSRYWRSPAACRQICAEKLLRAGTRHSHKPPERFELHSLELRRKITRLTTMSYKIVNGKIAVNIPEYIGGPTRVTRSYHSCKYNNFFTRTRKEWNTLPSFLLDQLSVDAFNSTVTNYLSSHWNYLLLSSTIYLIFVASNSTAFSLCVCFFFHTHIHSDGKPLWIIIYK